MIVFAMFSKVPYPFRLSNTFAWDDAAYLDRA